MALTIAQKTKILQDYIDSPIRKVSDYQEANGLKPSALGYYVLKYAESQDVAASTVLDLLKTGKLSVAEVAKTWKEPKEKPISKYEELESRIDGLALRVAQLEAVR